MIVAIPSLNGVLSSHFGGAEFFVLFEVSEDKKILNEFILPTPEHIEGSYPQFLAQNKVTDIIVGGVGGKAIDIFNQFGINVYTGAPSILPKTLVEQLLDNTLAVTDNTCDGGHHDHGHAHGEHHHHH